MSTPNFAYTSGNPDNLIGGRPAVMTDVQGPFYDLRAYLNGSIVPTLNSLSPPSALVTGGKVLDVGMLNQLRAGRQLTAADFTALGLSAPLGLWNLTDLTDASGNARALLNKGGVGFGTGINGIAGTAAQFIGSGGQALYISDTGAADPFRITTGSWGSWFKTAKKGVTQPIVSKRLASTQLAFDLYVNFQNVVTAWVAPDGATVQSAAGVTDGTDDRWHFAVATADGTQIRLYVDGVLEGAAPAGMAYPSNAPLNIGGEGADGANPSLNFFYGRTDEAFVTSDVLSEDQIRCLYAAKIVHTLGVVPRSATLNVSRQRKGGPLAVVSFSTQPLRLHNFTAGVLTDQGSNGQALTNNGAAVSVAGADGTARGAFNFSGAQSLSATDAGLPAALTTRSYGCWFKTSSGSGSIVVIAWGTVSTGDVKIYTGGGALIAANAADSITGPFVTDGQWHHAVAVEDNAALDGLKRKLYLDGRLVGGSTVMNAIALAGADRFRIGANPDGSAPFIGQIDGAFVCGYAMTQADVAALYAIGSQSLGPSPKNVGDHVERMDAGAVYIVADTLDSQHLIDLGVVA